MTQFGTNLVGIYPGKIETRGMPGLLGGSARRLTLDDARVLSRLPGVTAAVPTAYGSGVVKFGNRTLQRSEFTLKSGQRLIVEVNARRRRLYGSPRRGPFAGAENIH